MKKGIYYLPFLICLTFSSCANSTNASNENLCKNQYCFRDGALEYTITNTYNSKGDVATSLTRRIGKESVSEQYSSYEYNQDGLQTAYLTRTIDEGEIVLSGCNLTNYDNHGNVIKEVSISNDSLRSVADYSYVYDKNGNIIEEKKWTDDYFSEYPSTQHSFFTYDEQNRSIARLMYSWQDDPNKADISSTRIAYDQNKTTIVDFSKVYSATHANKKITVTEYNNRKQVISNIIYTYKVTEGGEELGEINKTYREYNEDGRICRETKYGANSTSGFTIWNEDITTYAYCGRNRDKPLSRTSISAKIHKVGEVINDTSAFSTMTYYYDDHERLIKRESIQGGDGNLSKARISTYIYEY